MWKVFHMWEIHLSLSEDTLWDLRPISLAMLNDLPLRSIFNKNPSSSPINHQRKEKQVNRTAEREQKSKQLLLYLLLPHCLEAAGASQVFCGHREVTVSAPAAPGVGP